MLLGVVTSSNPLRASALHTQRLIRLNCTPFGLPWDFDPHFGFAHYKDPMTDLRDALDGAVGRAEERFHTAFGVTVVAEVIGLIKNDAGGRGLVVAEDENLARAKQHGLEADLAALQERWADVSRRIAARRAEMEAEKVLGELLAFAKTAWAVAGLLAAGWGTIAALPALYDAMVKTAALTAGSGGGIVDDFVDFGKLEVRKDVIEAKKKATAFFDQSAKMFEAAKTVQAAASAVQDKQLAALLKEQAEIVVERARVTAGLGQVALEMNVVNARKQAAEAQSAAAIAALASSADAEKALTTMSLLLIDQIRLYADTLHRYHFEAARALQRWLFDETRLSLFCGYGWVEPSAEMALTEPAAPNQTPEQRLKARKDALLNYLAALRASVDRFDFAGLESSFIVKQEAAPLDYTSLLVALTDKQVSDYLTHGKIDLNVSLDNLPAKIATETRVEAVEILDTGGSGGARPKDISVTAGTAWQARMSDGTVRTGVDQPREVLVHPVTSKRRLEDLTAGKLSRLRDEGISGENVFWACSPVRIWTLTSAPIPAAPGDAGAAPSSAGRKMTLALVLSGTEGASA